VVDISYQNIPYPLLRDYLGEVEDEVVSELVTQHGWQIKGAGSEGEESGKVVVIKNQEATIRPKKILAKIEFDSELKRRDYGRGHVLGGGRGQLYYCLGTGNSQGKFTTKKGEVLRS